MSYGADMAKHMHVQQREADDTARRKILEVSTESESPRRSTLYDEGKTETSVTTEQRRVSTLCRTTLS